MDNLWSRSPQMNSEFHSLIFIFPSAKHWSFWFSPTLKLMYHCAVGWEGSQGPVCGGPVTPRSPVEDLWSSMQPKDEARLRQAGQLPPPAGHSPLPLPTLGSVLSHSWGDLLWQGLCFVRIWGAPGDQALSGDSLLSGLRCRTRSLWPAVFTSLPLPSASAVAPPCQLTKQIPCYFYFR